MEKENSISNTVKTDKTACMKLIRWRQKQVPFSESFCQLCRHQQNNQHCVSEPSPAENMTIVTIALCSLLGETKIYQIYMPIYV